MRTPVSNFQPMNANFGILDRLPMKVKGKKNRYEKMAEVALESLKASIAEAGIEPCAANA